MSIRTMNGALRVVNYRRLSVVLLLAIGFVLNGTAQQRYMNVHSGGKTISYPVEGVDSVTFTSVQPEESQLAGPRITQTIVKEQEKATVYNIAYPSTDPYGNPVTLSGSIILGDEVLPASMPGACCCTTTSRCTTRRRCPRWATWAYP